MSASYYIQALLSLGTIGALLYGLSKFSQHAQKKRFNGDMKILDRTSLSPQVTLWVVEIRQKSYVVGVGGKEISFFHPLDTPS